MMEAAILKTMKRNGKPKKVRTAGFIPGVLNGPGTASDSVQFDARELSRVVIKNGMSAKVWVEMGAEKKFGFLKEVQTHPVHRNIIHVTVQLVSQDQEIKMQVPITFQGSEELAQRMLHVNVNKSDIEVTGKAALIPDKAVVDVSEKNADDTVTAADFHLPGEIKILDSDEEVYAVIRAAKAAAAEEPEEEKEEESEPEE